jgi:hypothetical protein
VRLVWTSVRCVGQTAPGGSFRRQMPRSSAGARPPPWSPPVRRLRDTRRSMDGVRREPSLDHTRAEPLKGPSGPSGSVWVAVGRRRRARQDASIVHARTDVPGVLSARSASARRPPRRGARALWRSNRCAILAWHGIAAQGLYRPGRTGLRRVLTVRNQGATVSRLSRGDPPGRPRDRCDQAQH